MKSAALLRAARGIAVTGTQACRASRAFGSTAARRLPLVATQSASSSLFATPSMLQRRFFSGGDRVVPVPKMGDSITEGSLNTWKKNVGDSVKADEIVAIIDTDKVSVDILSPASGVITAHNVKPGDTVLVGAPLFSLKEGAVADAPKAAAPKAEAPKAAEAPKPAAEAPKPAAPAAAPAAPAPKAPQPIVGGDNRGEKRVPMSRMRQRIAERLKGAQNNAAMLTTFNECDMGAIMALRSEVNEDFQKRHGCKLGFVSAFMKASAMALQRMPEVNAYIEGKEIVYKDYVDISVAVATPTGLMVPVIRDCHKKTVAELERDLADLAKRARNNQIALEEMVGGTFTISNGGVYGSMMGTPILNPPQSAILGMHAIVDRPVVRNKEVVVRPVMYLALTYDHRIVDGREGVLCLKAIKEYIEKPVNMLLDL